MRRNWCHLATSVQGSVIPEYALLLGLVVGSAALACLTAVSSVDRTFSVASQFNLRGGANPDAAPALADDSGRRGWAQPANLLSPQQLQVAAGLAAALGIIVFGVAFASGVSALRVIRRRYLPPDRPHSGIEDAPPAAQPSMHEQLMEKRRQIRQILGRGLERDAAFDTPVQHLMSKRLSVVRPDMTVVDAVATMGDKHIRHLLVCSEEGRLLGILSDRDVQQRSGTFVRDIMTGSPVTVSPDLAIAPAITLMLQRSISCLPVVRDGALLGVLTTTDVLLSCQCMMQVLERVAAGLYGVSAGAGKALVPEAW